MEPILALGWGRIGHPTKVVLGWMLQRNTRTKISWFCSCTQGSLVVTIRSWTLSPGKILIELVNKRQTQEYWYYKILILKKIVMFLVAVLPNVSPAPATTVQLRRLSQSCEAKSTCSNIVNSQVFPTQQRIGARNLATRDWPENCSPKPARVLKSKKTKICVDGDTIFSPAM